MALSPKERAQLRSQAHHLKPLHQIGREGVTEAALRAIEEAFANRELIKVRVQQGAPLSAAEAAVTIAAGIPRVEHVQTIGRTIVLFRERPPDGEGSQAAIR